MSIDNQEEKYDFVRKGNVVVNGDGNINMVLAKVLANPTNLTITDNPIWREPKAGDKVKITSWDTQSYVQECVRLSKFDYLTVKEVYPIVVGTGNGKYQWAYGIFVNESELSFLQWHFELI